MHGWVGSSSTSISAYQRKGSLPFERKVGTRSFDSFASEVLVVGH